MLQRGGLDPVPHAGNVEQRGRHGLVAEDPALAEMQPARPHPDHRLARLDADCAIALLIEVAELPAQRFHDVVDALVEMLPLIRHRILEVEHHARRAGIEHLHDQVGVVGRAGHLVPLIPAPVR